MSARVPSHHGRRSRRSILVALCAVSLTLGSLAACGDSSGSGPDAEPTAAGPERIVSMSATATEMLFAIDAGDRVVAADSQSDHPAEAPTTELSAYEPNVEAIADHDPDLVVLSDDINDVRAQLDELSIDVVVQPAATSLEDTYEQIRDLGELTDNADAAEDLVEEMQGRVDDLTGRVPERAEPLTYYHELDDTLFTVTSDTFIGELYALAGLENVADPADADGQSGGYPQLTAEFLVDADPDLVFLADTVCCAQDASTFAARPGFAGMQAVERGNVVELDDDVASRWGPRVVDFLEAIVTAVEAVPTE